MVGSEMKHGEEHDFNLLQL